MQRLSLPPLPLTVQGLLSDWMTNLKIENAKQAMYSIISILWYLWKERNRRIFNFEAYSYRKIIETGVAVLKDWLQAAKWRNQELTTSLFISLSGLLTE